MAKKDPVKFKRVWKRNRRKNAKKIDYSKPTYKYLICDNCGLEEIKADANSKSAVCWRCVAEIGYNSWKEENEKRQARIKGTGKGRGRPKGSKNKKKEI